MLDRLRKHLSQSRKPGTGTASKPPAWKELGGLAALLAAAAALLVAAMLLPLAFRVPDGGSDTETGNSAQERRAALFSDYWYRDGAGVTVNRSMEPTGAMQSFCRERMAQLTARCIDDQAVRVTEATGSEYVLLTGEDGTVLRLCRMWLQTRGDWQNWMDVCFDAESGLLYYLYVSRECFEHAERYAAAERAGPAALAEELAKAAGGRLRAFAGDGTAVIQTAGSVLCYQIHGSYYDTLVDVRINSI